MKNILFNLVIIGLLSLFFSTHAMAGKIEKRQAQQHKRIWQGISNGQLTRYEVRNLWHEQQKIRWMKKSFWRDGRLNHRERRHLFHWLDRADRHIFQLKHNGRHNSAIGQRASYNRYQRYW